MIFKVILNGSRVIYDGNNPTGILDPQLEIELNAAGSFTFILPSGSDVINDITPFTSEIDVYEDEEMIWFGRVLNKEKLWNNQCRITCEGGLAYFNDSIQDKKTWESTRTENQEGVVYEALIGQYIDGQGNVITNPYAASDGDVTMAMFFRDLIEWHNGQVSDDRQWEVGTIAPEFGLSKIWRETNRETTSDCLQTMCLDTDGGYFITRKEYVIDPTEGRVAKRYIDWVNEMPYGSTQNIEFGVNLLDVSNSINGADICTSLVPIGADELTIYDVPDTGSKESPVDGCYHKKKTYTVIYAASEAVYGRVQKTKEWSDITDKESLYKKAVEYLKEQNTDIPSIECSAAELHYLDGHHGETAFRVGQFVRVVSPVHGIIGNYPLLKISMSLNSGAKRVTIGTPPKKELTDIVKNTSGTSSRNTTGGSTGSGSGGSSGGSGYVGVKDVRLKKPGDVEYESTVKNKISKIDLSGMVKDVKLNGTSVVTEGQALLPAYPTIPVEDVLYGGSSLVVNKKAIIPPYPTIPVTDVVLQGGSSLVVNGVAIIPESKTLNSGEYINIDENDNISVNRKLILPYTCYIIITKSTEEYEITIEKYVNNELVSSTDYDDSPTYREGVNIDGFFILKYSYNDYWSYTLLRKDSEARYPGYTYTWHASESVNITESFSLTYIGTNSYEESELVINKDIIKDVNYNGISVINNPTMVNKTVDIYDDTAITHKDLFDLSISIDRINILDPITQIYTFNGLEVIVGDAVYKFNGDKLVDSSGHDTLVFVNKNIRIETDNDGGGRWIITLIEPTTLFMGYVYNGSSYEYISEAKPAGWRYSIYFNHSNLISQDIRYSISDPRDMVLARLGDISESVEANPSETATDDLETIKIGDTVYKLKGDGSVEANPSETATDDLESIKIGDTVYKLKGDGATVMCLSDYYDTEERVVGRWTDGKPLYQKTYDFGTDVQIGNSRGVDLSSYVSNYMEYEQIIYCLGYGTYNGRYADPLYLTTTLNNELMAWCAEGMTVRGITVQYTKTADAPGTGPTPGNIMYLPAMYSEEEREVGVWTDGKPLYQKTIYLGTLTRDTSWHYVNHNISDIDTVVRITGKINNSNSSELYWYDLPIHRANSNSGITIGANETVIQYMNNWLSPNADCSVNLRYTKTTDQPGSGKYLPDGQLSHHYSTSEHIIGMWIDGSTLYERTWDFGSDVSLTANNWYDTSISNSGISLLTNVEAISANGNFRGQIEGSANPSGSYIQLRSDGIASSVRYVTLRYTKTS